MVKWAHPENHIQAMLFTKLNKFSQIAASVEPESSFLFFVMNPEHIGGNYIDAAHFHLNQFIFPSCIRHSGIMELSANSKKGPIIFLHVKICKGYFLSLPVFPPEILSQRIDLLFLQIS